MHFYRVCSTFRVEPLSESFQRAVFRGEMTIHDALPFEGDRRLPYNGPQYDHATDTSFIDQRRRGTVTH